MKIHYINRDPKINPVKTICLENIISLQQPKLCIENKLLTLLDIKRGERPEWKEIIVYLDRYVITNDLYSVNNILQPDDNLSEALDYEEFADLVIEGRILVKWHITNDCSIFFPKERTIHDYRLTYDNINLILSEKCKPVDNIFLEILKNIKCIIFFLNGRAGKTNVYIVMEIIEQYNYSHNFTYYELFNIINPLLQPL